MAQEQNAIVVEERGNAYISVSASVSGFPHIASDVARIVENKNESIESAPASLHRLKPSRAKQCADKPLQVKRAANDVRFILPSAARM
jgi:hypothetical protein